MLHSTLEGNLWFFFVVLRVTFDNRYCSNKHTHRWFWTLTFFTAWPENPVHIPPLIALRVLFFHPAVSKNITAARLGPAKGSAWLRFFWHSCVCTIKSPSLTLQRLTDQRTWQRWISIKTSALHQAVSVLLLLLGITLAQTRTNWYAAVQW